MKHAILILGYRNFDFVQSRITLLDEDFIVFVHWDKRYKLTQDQLTWAKNNGVNVYQEYECNYASFGIVRATLLLYNKAILYTGCTYFHLISDMCIIVPNLVTFKQFFADNVGISYIQGSKMDKEFILALQIYHRLELYDFRNNLSDLELYKLDMDKQINNNEIRQLPEEDIYGGSQWTSLYRTHVEYLLSKEEFIYKYFIDTNCPDEFFVQTVLYNSPYVGSICNSNLRYIQWNTKHGNCPAILDESDYEDILSSYKINDTLFVRKIDPVISASLVQKLDKAKDNLDDVVRELKQSDK